MHIDFAHWHLLLNHFPVIGSIIGAGLFLTSFFLHAESLRRSSLFVFAAVAVLTIPAFVSGAGAQVDVLKDPQTSNDLIQRHIGSAELAIWLMMITGVLSGIALWQSGRSGSPVVGWNTAAILLFSLATVGAMARTGNTGGEIRHREIRADLSANTNEPWIAHFEPSASKFANLMIKSKWWWAFMMGLHFIGLVLVIGTIGILDLRILGFARQLPIEPLHKLIPLGLAGFGLNLVTGILAFIGMQTYYTYNIAFLLKMIAIPLALGSLALYYLAGACEDCEAIGPGEDAPLSSKFVAGISLFLWFAVIVLGRYIQPLENSVLH